VRLSVAKSNKEKAMGKMDMGQAVSPTMMPKRNDARMTIRVEKKMVDGKETIHSSLECDEYEFSATKAPALKK
jgi:hypothetical protein